MNYENLHALIDRYEEQFDTIINNGTNEEIFKWRAVKCFQDVWFAPDAESMSFVDRFRAATKECSVLLDNGHVSPTSGILKMAEQEPEKVERLFVDVLFADDQGDLVLRQDHVEEFLEGIEAVRQRCFPQFWKYGQDRHCAFTYLALYAPEENYIYKYSETAEMAKYIEYGFDIGSGQNFKLPAYYGMCDLIVAALREHPSLLKRHWDLCDETYYHDESLHLLAFDVIYCSRTYNLYHGLDYTPKEKSAKARTRQELREKEAEEARARVAELEAQIQAKDVELDQYRSISLINVQVTYGSYGAGVVIYQKDNTVKVRFHDGTEKTFVIHAKFSARPTFEDDEQIVAAFTEYDRLTKEIQVLNIQLKSARAKL